MQNNNIKNKKKFCKYGFMHLPISLPLQSFNLFYRYLFSQRSNAVIRRVSLICFFGLMISIGSLLIVFNIMGGLGQSIKDRFLATEPHVIISLKKALSPSEIQKKKQKIKNILKVSQLQSGVSSFYFFESVEIIIRTLSGSFVGAVARGYNSQYFNTFLINSNQRISSQTDILDNIPIQKKKLSVNSPLKQKKTFKKIKKKPQNIIMGLGLASDLDLYKEEIIYLIPAENILLPQGESIDFELAKVQSLVSTQNATWNSHYIFYDKKHFASFNQHSSYESGFEIRLKQPEQFLTYQKTLEKEGFLIEVWPEQNSSIFFALKLEKFIMSIFLSLAGLITLLAVSSLLVLLMVQKKKEIGALMAMGLAFPKIQSLFVKIGLLLCAFGMLGATVFSISVSLFLKYVPLPFLSSLYLENNFPIEINFEFMFYVFISVFLFALIICILSVKSQSRYSSSELLKAVKG